MYEDIKIGTYSIPSTTTKRHSNDGIWIDWNPAQGEDYIILSIEAMIKAGFTPQMARLSDAGERLSVFFKDNRRRQYQLNLLIEVDRVVHDEMIHAWVGKLSNGCKLLKYEIIES